MRYWIDIENTNGVRLGDGPIMTAQAWTHTARLDRAGTFSFTMAADDPRRELLAVKRIARCWTYQGGALQHLGAGIINDIALRLAADGAPVVTVSGDDLLHELTYRNVGELALQDDSWFHPNEFFLLGYDESVLYEDDAAAPYGKENSATLYNLDLAIDRAPGDTTTRESDARANAYNRRVVIKGPQQFNTIRTIDYRGASIPAGSMYYWDVDDDAYVSLGFEASTEVIGGLYYQTITFSPPATWGIKTGDVGYKVCFKNVADGFNGDIYDISLRGERPTETVLGPIMGYAPAGWTLDTANGYYEITGYGEYGPNLITNPSFETYTGTADDGTTDTFDGWTNERTSVTAIIEASATASAGGTALKIAHNAYPGDPDYKPATQQAITVEGGATYLFEADARGDGAQDGYYAFSTDGDPLRGLRVLSYQWTGNKTTSYARHQQIIYVAPDITTVYLELRGVDIDYAGTVYWDNLSLRKVISGGDVQLTFANESVLEALIRVCETNGEHFILSPSGRQVLWLRNDVRSTGVRCVGNVDAQAVEDEPDIALLVDVQETQSAYDLVSRVYPFGGGSGDERATLAHCTRAVPDGYTLNTTDNYIERTAAVTAYGRIDRRLDLPDIVASSQAPAQLQYTSNMLFDRALVYLRRHSATSTALTTGDVPRAYNLTLAKCDRVLLPGYTVKVEYETWHAQERQISINRDLWILSSTVRVDEAGIHTVALQCATTDTPPMTDAMLLADMLRKQRASFAHAPGV